MPIKAAYKSETRDSVNERNGKHKRASRGQGEFRRIHEVRVVNANESLTNFFPFIIGYNISRLSRAQARFNIIL